jgi:23S rRNA (uracil1939-C5)-methyltransferase
MALCRHFGSCGGCTLQDIPDSDYRARKREIIAYALTRHGLEIAIEESVSVPPRSRRRTALKAGKTGASVAVGFNATASHTIVDMRECHVLTPRLTALVAGLREMMASWLRDGEKADLGVTETDTGFDLQVTWDRRSGPSLPSDVARSAQKLGIARITVGDDIAASFSNPSLRIAGAEVRPPPFAFLQPTVAGELALQSGVVAALKGAKHVADLFAGCGTFSLALASSSSVHAIDLDGAMLAALGDAARRTPGLKPVTTERRNLFRRPLGRGELDRFDAVVLDPPRAGALEQVRMLAQSRVPRVAYVSCDAQSFARDCATLLEGGYRTHAVTPVDQFLWSEHIELMAVFETSRGGKAVSSAALAGSRRFAG